MFMKQGHITKKNDKNKDNSLCKNVFMILGNVNRFNGSETYTNEDFSRETT